MPLVDVQHEVDGVLEQRLGSAGVICHPCLDLQDSRDRFGRRLSLCVRARRCLALS